MGILAKVELIGTKTLATLTAGGDSYIRTKNGTVKGIAIRPKLNPEAPEIILVGKGPRIIQNAHLLFQTDHAIPTYMKRATDAWEGIGYFRAVDFRTDPEAIQSHASAYRPADTLAGVLFLERTDAPTVAVYGGGFPDSKTRKEIEKAAISVVTSELEHRKYVVEDRQSENLGYDLLARRSNEELFVEVKGTSANDPHFYITKNEWKVGSVQPNWRLFVVCDARTSPTLYEYNFQEMCDAFTRDALAWECSLNKK